MICMSKIQIDLSTAVFGFVLFSYLTCFCLLHYLISCSYILCTHRSILLVVVHPQRIHHLLLIKPHLHQCNDSLQ